MGVVLTNHPAIDTVIEVMRAYLELKEDETIVIPSSSCIAREHSAAVMLGLHARGGNWAILGTITFIEDRKQEMVPSSAELETTNPAGKYKRLSCSISSSGTVKFY